MTAPDVLAFADRKTDGSFAVTEPSGDVVAWIGVSFWTRASFEAMTAVGEPLCRGRRRGYLSTSWDATDAVDRPIASIKASWGGRRKQVQMADGRQLVLEGTWFGRDWSLHDDAGHVVLSSEPTTSAWSFQPDAWVVRCHDAALDLAAVVGVVELNRLMLKAARSTRAATT